MCFALSWCNLFWPMCRKPDTEPPTYLTIHGFVCRQSLLNHPAYGASTVVNGAWAGVKAAVVRVPLSHTHTRSSLFFSFSLSFSLVARCHRYCCADTYIYIFASNVYQVYTDRYVCIYVYYIVRIICMYDYTCMHIYRTLIVVNCQHERCCCTDMYMCYLHTCMCVHVRMLTVCGGLFSQK